VFLWLFFLSSLESAGKTPGSPLSVPIDGICPVDSERLQCSDLTPAGFFLRHPAADWGVQRPRGGRNMLIQRPRRPYLLRRWAIMSLWWLESGRVSSFVILLQIFVATYLFPLKFSSTTENSRTDFMSTSTTCLSVQTRLVLPLGILIDSWTRLIYSRL
jgi:hypothetical protein